MTANNNRITLFKHETDHIKISMELYFNEKDELIFDGYDIGKTVDEIWGDSDYEYTYSIKPTSVGKLYRVLGVTKDDRNALLIELKKRFGHNKGYSEFGKFMEKHGIKYDGFTYT